MGKQRRLVRQQLIEAAIQRVLGDQPIILAQQIRHRALLEPLPMQAPLAAGIDQPIAHQRLQDVLPAGAFARIRQQRCKEPIQLQLLIEMTGQPRRPPWGRAMPLHRIEPHLYPKALGMIRHPLLGRKQGKLPMPPAPLVEPLDHPAPRRVLTVVDLAQIQNRTLHHPTARTAPAFDNAPIPVLLAVLPSPCESQVHGPRFYAQTKIRKERRSSLHAFSPHRPLRRFSFFRQNSKIRGPVGKVGLASTAFSSDLRLNSSWRSPAICPNLISIATPIAIRLFARAEPHCSKNESYGGWRAAIATSAITPATTRKPPHRSQRSHDPIERSKSPSLALIMPFGRRHAGKGLVGGFWAAITISLLAW